MFIQEKRNRVIWQLTLGISAGILLGGGTASIENQTCTQAATPPDYCLTETPRVRVAQGMVGGAFASGGALLLIDLWSRFQKPD